MIFDARASRAPWITLVPTAPEPNTATLLPGRTPAVYSAAPTPVITPQAIRHACAGGTSGEMGTAWLAWTTVCVAKVPSPMIGGGYSPLGVCWRGLPFRLAAQR